MLLDKLRQIEERSEELERALADPKIYGQPAEFARLRKEHADSSEIVERFREYREVLRRLGEAQDFAVLTEALDDLAAVGVLFAKPGELRRLTVDLGVGECALQLFRALLDLPQLVKQHRGSPGDGPARGDPRCCLTS